MDDEPRLTRQPRQPLGEHPVQSFLADPDRRVRPDHRHRGVGRYVLGWDGDHVPETEIGRIGTDQVEGAAVDVDGPHRRTGCSLGEDEGDHPRTTTEVDEDTVGRRGRDGLEKEGRAAIEPPVTEDTAVGRHGESEVTDVDPDPARR